MATVDTSANKENSSMNEAPTKTIEDPATLTTNSDKKEEEPVISTKPTTDPSPSTDNKTDTDPQKKPSEPLEEQVLLSKGTELLKSQNYNDSAVLLSNAMSIVQQKSIATSIESIPYYMAYGKALLRLIQSSNDLFAAPIREKQQQHFAEQQEAEQEEEEVAPVLVSDAVADKEDPKPAENDSNSKEEQDEEDQDLDLAQKNEEVEDVMNEGGVGMTGNGDVDTSEDREIAWETFECARTILEDYLSVDDNGNDMDKVGLLGEVHSFLGEICIEDDNYELALEEYVKSIDLQNKCGVIGRKKASNHFYASLAAQFCEKEDVAVKHCKDAMEIVSECIVGLLNGFECNECKKDMENDELMKIVTGFVEGMDDEKKESENGKELIDLMGLMADLMSKYEELEQVIKYKKLKGDKKEEDNNDNNEGLMNLMNSDDPLSAFINGLTQKLGINEEELAKMEMNDDRINGDDDNKNNGDDGDVKDAEDGNKGVTQIGFGNNNDEDDDAEINDLGSFGKKKEAKKEEENAVQTVSSRKKRSLEEAEIDDGLNGNVKRMKLNSGDAVPVVVDNEDGK